MNILFFSSSVISSRRAKAQLERTTGGDGWIETIQQENEGWNGFSMMLWIVSECFRLQRLDAKCQKQLRKCSYLGFPLSVENPDMQYFMLFSVTLRLWFTVFSSNWVSTCRGLLLIRAKSEGTNKLAKSNLNIAPHSFLGSLLVEWRYSVHLINFHLVSAMLPKGR